jgi:hypothetical protein
MSDFVIRKKEERTPKSKTVSAVKITRKELSLFIKLIAFVAAFSGLIFLSISSNNLMLKEILVSGGILSLVLLIRIITNR